MIIEHEWRIVPDTGGAFEADRIGQVRHTDTQDAVATESNGHYNLLGQWWRPDVIAQKTFTTISVREVLPQQDPLTSEERETHFNMTGDDHGRWIVYTDDPYWIRRLDKVATAYKVSFRGGKHYELDASQVTVRARPKELSVEEKERRAAILRQVSGKNVVNSRSFDGENGKSVAEGTALNTVEVL